MELAELIQTKGIISKPRQDRGAAFGEVLQITRERAKELTPEDRGVKPGSIVYGGQQEIIKGVKGHVIKSSVDQKMYALTDGAFFQLAGLVGPSNGERLNFPGYLRACLAHDERLVSINLQAWMQANKEKQMLLRSVSPRGISVGRAFLSERYVPVDDLDVLEILEKIEEATSADVRMLEIGEESFHLKLSWRRERHEVKVGDVIEFGVSISNSEVGKRAVRIEPMVWRLNCGNGMIGRAADLEGGVWYVRHAGRTERVLSVVTDALRASLPAAREMSRLMAASVKEQIDKPVERLKSLAKEEGLSESIISSATEEMLREAAGGPVTKFDFINGVTGAGRQQKNADLRYDLERLGASLLSRDLPLPLIEESKRSRN
jgi:hypothetical protein